MERVAEYQAIIKRTIREYARHTPDYEEIEVEIIEDDSRGHYELWYLGWNRAQRIHWCVIHVDLKGEKVWIQHDGTPTGLANDFMEAGIPASQIVLAFHTPRERKLTPFAVS